VTNSALRIVLDNERGEEGDRQKNLQILRTSSKEKRLSKKTKKLKGNEKRKGKKVGRKRSQPPVEAKLKEREKKGKVFQKGTPMRREKQKGEGRRGQVRFTGKALLTGKGQLAQGQ